MEQQPTPLSVCPRGATYQQGPTPHVRVQCLTPVKTPKPILWMPDAQSAWLGRDFYLKALVSFFLAESQGRRWKCLIYVANLRKNYQQRRFPPFSYICKGKHFKEVPEALILLCSCWFASHWENQGWKYGLIKWEVKWIDKRKGSINVDKALCRAQAPRVKPYLEQLRLVHSLAGTSGSCADWFWIGSSSCPPSCLPLPAVLICRTKSWLPPALLRWYSIQSGVEGWAVCAHRGWARKRQPLHMRGSAHQEQSRFYAQSENSPSVVVQPWLDPDFEG